jgi:hypothetical protein
MTSIGCIILDAINIKDIYGSATIAELLDLLLSLSLYDGFKPSKLIIDMNYI